MKVKKPIKRVTPALPDVAAVITKIVEAATDDDVSEVLDEFTIWRYPRGDLGAWVPALDRLDDILASVISSYDLSKLQASAFTPSTRKLLLGILRLEKLLVENCTSRKLFSSYERLADLLLTTDLDVLIATIQLLFRCGQQYGAQIPCTPTVRASLVQRLLILTRGWERASDLGYTLYQLATVDEIVPPATSRSITLQFYPTDQGSALSTSTRPSPSKLVTLDLGDVTETMVPEPSDKIGILAEQHYISANDQLDLLNRVRLVTTMPRQDTRLRQLMIKLSALAAFIYIASDETVQSSLFLYNTSLVGQLAELMAPNTHIPGDIIGAATCAIDACAHHRSKLSEVLSALNANVSHGILVSLLRQEVDKLVSEENVQYPPIDALYSLIAFIGSTPPHSNLLIGAGIIPVLLKLLATDNERRDSLIPRALGLIENMAFAGNQGLTALLSAGGLTTLVERVRVEIRTILAMPGPQASYSLSDETILFYRTNPLRALLRSIHRLMQASGLAEGLRNLVDSDLPKLLREIFASTAVFGTRVYSLAINVMATFIHNEPTSLSILQEIKLPQTLYDHLEQGIPSSFDILLAIPSAIGAICLNQAGLDYVVGHPKAISNLVHAMSTTQTDELSSMRGSAVHCGSALDELVRHQPVLRPIVLKALIHETHLAKQAGQGFEPSDLEMARYVFNAESPPKKEDPTMSNEPLVRLISVLRLWSGLLRNSAVYKDFIAGDSLDIIIDLLHLPCVPLSSTPTELGAQALEFYATLGEHDPLATTASLMRYAEEKVDEFQELIRECPSSILWLSDTDAHILKAIRALNVRLGLFFQFTRAVLSMPHGRTTTGLLKLFSDTASASFVNKIGILHRSNLHQLVSLQLDDGTGSVDAVALISFQEQEAKGGQNAAAIFYNPLLHRNLTGVIRVIAKLLFPRRNADTDHKAAADKVAMDLAHRVKDVLEIASLNTTRKGISLVSTAVALSATIQLLFDERGHDGFLLMVLFIKFESMGGLAQLVSVIQPVVQAMEVEDPQADSIAAKELELAKTALRPALQLLSALVSNKSMMENPQTSILRQQNILGGKHFEAGDMIIEIRLLFFPLLKGIWEAAWLLKSPANLIKSTVRAFLVLVDGKNEEEPAVPVPAPISRPTVPATRPQITADPGRITQLEDMGFSRHLAEAALLRARNNITAAADLLLNSPHLLDLGRAPGADAANAVTMEGILPAEVNASPEASDEVPGDQPMAPAGMVGLPAENSSATARQTHASETSAAGRQPAMTEDHDMQGEEARVDAVIGDQQAPTLNKMMTEDLRLQQLQASRLALSAYRSSAKVGLPQRAIDLLDANAGILFDTVPAFPPDVSGLALLLSTVNQAAAALPNVTADVFSARLRLLALFIRNNSELEFDEDCETQAQYLLKHTSYDQSPRPDWLPTFLLVVETILSRVTSIVTVKIGDDPTAPVTRSWDEGDSIRLSKTCVTLVEDESSSDDAIFSAYRLMVLLGRDQIASTEYASLIVPFRRRGDNGSAWHSLLALLLRHQYETRETLVDVMRREINFWLASDRNQGKSTDINHLVRQLRQVAARNPAAFVDAVECECELVNPSPVSSLFKLRTRVPKAPHPSTIADVFQETPSSNSSAMVFLLEELGKASRQAILETNDQELSKSEALSAVAYSGLLLSVITELVGSYLSAKSSFVSTLKSRGFAGLSSHRSGLVAFFHDLVCNIDIRRDFQEDSVRLLPDSNQACLASCSMVLIVALVSDLTVIERKDKADELLAIRKGVFDIIAKALKENTALSLDPNLRYGRLWAISELVFRLLESRSRSPVGTRQPDETSRQIAKALVERQFVGLLTSAIGSVDLHFPHVRPVLANLLRALEILSALSVKLAKSETIIKPSRRVAEEEEQSSDEEDEHSDVAMSDPEQEPPDLYRNSALGILEGDIDDNSSEGDIEEGDDDDLMEYDDEGLEGLDEDDADTEPSTGEEDHEQMDEDTWTESVTEEDGEEMSDIFIDDQDGEGEVMIADEDPIAETWEDDEDEEAFHLEADEEDLEEFAGFLEYRPDDDDEDEMEGEDDDDDDEAAFSRFGTSSLPIPVGDTSITFSGGNERAGHWGWDRNDDLSARGPGRQSRLLDDPMSALFGPSSSRRQGLSATHPLLVDPAARVSSQGQGRLARVLNDLGGGYNDLLSMLEARAGPGASVLLERILARHSGHNGGVRVGVSPDPNGGIGLHIGGREYNFPAHSPELPDNQLRSGATNFIPQFTLSRWQEESTLGLSLHSSSISKLVIHIINRLLPEARSQAERDSTKLTIDETLGDATSPATGSNEALTALAAQSSPRGESSAVNAESQESAGDQTVSTQNATVPVALNTDPLVEEASAQTANPARVTISIHGREIDITDSGIDMDFLQALPEEMRADVVEQHMREQNRPVVPPVPTDGASAISPEFLEALPPEIRAEVMLQEALEHARRVAGPAEESSGLTQRPFVNRDNGFLSNLNSDLRNVMTFSSTGQPISISRATAGAQPVDAGPVTPGKAPKRDGVRLLDKPGVAALVRLLFIPESLKRNSLYRIMSYICENSVTRGDLLNLLVSVVQDGTGDLPAVDKSFQQMSIKSISTPKSTPKPKYDDLSTSGSVTQGLFGNLPAQHVPTFIAQRCIEALSFITDSNMPVITYLLTEHEQPAESRRSVAKKAKGKEKLLPLCEFPVVVLMGLLERTSLLQTAGMMESITNLLSVITKPLAGLKSPSSAGPSHNTVSTVPVTNASATANIDTPRAVEAMDMATNAAASALTDTAISPRASAEGGLGLLTMPVIPSPVLRLLVNCLTVGECSSRTFSQALSVMQNLSVDAAMKSIILDELGLRAQALGTTLVDELAILSISVQKRNDQLGTIALKTFSPASSSQAQLLRILKTIDFLHFNRPDSLGPDEQFSEGELAAGAIYDALAFDAMWAKLGECLSLVEEHGDSDQIATLLLPLLESLMVVCKYRKESIREVRSPSLPPATSIGPQTASNLFVSFTTHHRKVLNAIVRSNPGLLSGSFSLLINNPRVLEFDNKRHWFLQKLKRKRDQPAASSVLQLNVRRQYVFEDSFHNMQRRSGEEIKFGKLNVKFYQEDGIDAGGVTREWFSVLAQQIFDPNFALFEPCAADQQTYQPNKASAVNDDHLAYFKFVGRVIGKAVFDGRLLDAYFSRAFYKQILGKTVDMRDLESIDPEFHKSLQWMLDNDITGVIDEDFTIEDVQFGEKKIVELKEGGAAMPVTEDNKEEYVRLVVSYRLDNSIKEQIKAFLSGFYEIVPRHLIQIFEPDQLELLISGISQIDVDELKNATQLSGWKVGDPEVAWFWRALRSFSQEERARFLMFVTSSSRVPLGGFTQLQGSSGVQPFQLQKLYAKSGSLPQASTCFNLLLLPQYESYEQLRERLQFAVVETGGFGKA